MTEINNKEMQFLNELNVVITNKNNTIFGFIKELSEKDSSIIDIVASLESKGVIKVDWLGDYPVNIELNDLSKNIINNQGTINLDKNKGKDKSKYIYLLIGFILGFILGYLIFILK